jgi:CheY-like chemotaxis protein
VESAVCGFIPYSKILIVDDERDMVETCVRLLQPLCHACLIAYDGPEAINLIDAEQPDIVLTDLNLPTGDGLDVAKHALRKKPDTAVIVMTAYHTLVSAQVAYEAGASAYLRKPFATAELVDAVHRGIDGRHP